jgi:hypothetical protein
MDVTAAGTVSPNRLDSLVPPAPPVNSLPATAPQTAGSGQTVDRIAGTLQDLTTPQIGELLNLLEHAGANQDPMQLEGLLRAAVSSAHAHKLPEALKAIENMITISPDHALTLIRNEGGLVAIRNHVGELMQRLTIGAKAEAERTILAAAMVVASAPALVNEATGVPQKDLLDLAKRFIESGQYANYVRATELGHMILRTKAPAAKSSGPQFAWLVAMWRRAPLLVLLLAWLAIGLLGGSIAVLARVSGAGPVGDGWVEVWATGFLALVLFQFFWTVRNFR